MREILCVILCVSSVVLNAQLVYWRYYAPEEDAFRVSVKLATSNPFDLADQRHPTGSRRKGVITGKYNGGVFVTLPDDVTMLCRYTQMLHDSDFAIGDSVIAQVQSYNYQRKQIFGKILVRR